MCVYVCVCACVCVSYQQHATLTFTKGWLAISGINDPRSVVCTDTPPRGPAHLSVARLTHPRDRVATLGEGVGRYGSVVTKAAIGYFCQIVTRWERESWERFAHERINNQSMTDTQR